MEKEVGPICRLMEVLLRCSKILARQSIQEIAWELYPLLLTILLLDKVMSAWSTPSPTTHLIKWVSSFPVLLRESPDTDRLLRLLREAILISISGSIKRRTLSGIFQLLKGLTLNDESRRWLMTSPGFFEMIVANFGSLRVVSFHVATFLLVLAQDATNKSKMVDTPGFIEVLTKLLSEEGAQTRKVAIGILKLVTTEKNGRTKVVSVGGTAFFDSLFECTKKNDIQEACFESIRQLILCPDTAKTIYSHENFINSMLKEKIFHTPSCPQTAILAAKVINRLSSFLSVNGKGMDRFLDVILQISSSKHDRIRNWGAKALLKQSQVEACSFFLMRTQPVVRTISNLSVDENPHVHSTAMTIVSNLASFSLNQRLVARNRALLASLAATVEDSGEKFGEDAKREAVLAFLHLANNKKTKMIIAKQHRVVASLSKYGVLTRGNDKDLKQAALHCVIWLTPFM